MSKRKFRNEKAFQAWLVKQLREEFKDEVVVIPTTMTGYGMSGVGDILMCFLGMFWSVELKMDGKQPTPLQMEFAAKVGRAGGRTAIPVTPNADEHGNGGVDNFLEWMRSLKQYRDGRAIVQSMTEEETRAAVDEGLAKLEKEDPEKFAKVKAEIEALNVEGSI